MTKDHMKEHPFFRHIFVEIKQCTAITCDYTEQPETELQLWHTIWLGIKGKGYVYIDNRPLRFESGTILAFLPGTAVKLNGADGERLSYYRLCFNLFRLETRSDQQITFERETSFPVIGKIGHASSSSLLRLLKTIDARCRIPGDLDPIHDQGYMHEVFHHLLLAETSGAPMTGDPIQQTLKHMQLHYSLPITLQSLASIANAHPNHYAMLFKRRLHKSPIEYLNHLRMNKAKELMLTSQSKIKHIAQLTGFGDEFYFSRRFKSACGVAPTVYLKAHSPTQIASLSSPYTDHLSTLGIEPHTPEIGEELLLSEFKWEKRGTDGLANWETTRKALLASKPDVILCKGHIVNETKMYMGDIAPILTIPWLELDLFGHIREIARLVGRVQQADSWLDWHRRETERARRKVARVIGRVSAAICVVTGDKIKFYGDRNIGHVFYRSLKLMPPDPVRIQMEKHPPGTIFNWMGTSVEQFERFAADYLFVLLEQGKQADEHFAKLKQSEGWLRHPAVLKGRMHLLTYGTWIEYSPSAISTQLELAVSLLAKSPT